MLMIKFTICSFKFKLMYIQFTLVFKISNGPPKKINFVNFLEPLSAVFYSHKIKFWDSKFYFMRYRIRNFKGIYSHLKFWRLYTTKRGINSFKISYFITHNKCLILAKLSCLTPMLYDIFLWKITLGADASLPTMFFCDK